VHTAAEAFAALSEAMPALGGLSYEDLGTQGGMAKATVQASGG
jgi:hypothetical protein